MVDIFANDFKDIITPIKIHYTSKMRKLLLPIIGSLPFLGNPVALF